MKSIILMLLIFGLALFIFIKIGRADDCVSYQLGKDNAIECGNWIAIVGSKPNLQPYWDRRKAEQSIVLGEIQRQLKKDIAELQVEKLWLLEQANSNKVYVSARSFGSTITNTSTSSVGTISNR